MKSPLGAAFPPVGTASAFRLRATVTSPRPSSISRTIRSLTSAGTVLLAAAGRAPFCGSPVVRFRFLLREAMPSPFASGPTRHGPVAPDAMPIDVKMPERARSCPSGQEGAASGERATISGRAALDRVRAAGAAYRDAEEARDRAREELRAALLEALDEGIPLIVAARAAGISAKAARVLARRA